MAPRTMQVKGCHREEPKGRRGDPAQTLMKVLSRDCFALLAMTFLCVTTVHAAGPDWEAYQKSGHQSPKWNSLVQGGFESFDTGNWSTASNFLERARNKGCKDGLVLFKLGLYQEYLKEYSKAVALMKQADGALQKQYPDHATTRAFHETLGRIYYEWDHYDEALPEIEQAIQQLGENFMRLLMAGQILRMQQQWKAAISAFEKALQYDPPKGMAGNPKQLVLMELMKAHYETGDYDTALQYANIVLKTDPANNLALTYKRQIEQKRHEEHEREVLEKMIK